MDEGKPQCIISVLNRYGLTFISEHLCIRKEIDVNGKAVKFLKR